MGIVGGGTDGKARRHRQPDVRHLCQISAFAAKQFCHTGVAFVEAVNPFIGHLPVASQLVGITLLVAMRLMSLAVDVMLFTKSTIINHSMQKRKMTRLTSFQRQPSRA